MIPLPDQGIVPSNKICRPRIKKSPCKITLTASNNLLAKNIKLVHKIAVIYNAQIPINFDKTEVDYTHKFDQSRNKTVTVVKLEIEKSDKLSIESLLSHLMGPINEDIDDKSENFEICRI